MHEQSLLQNLESLPADMPALVYKGRTYTIGELLLESRHLANGLLKRGVRAGNTAVLATPPNAAFLHIVFAALRIGLRLAVIDPEMGRDNYRSKLAQLQPEWAFVDSRLLLLQEHPLLRALYLRWSKRAVYFPYSKQIQIIATGARLPLWQKNTPLRRLYDALAPETASAPLPDWPEFFITYTSGTTGEPKGVVHGTKALSNSMQLIASLLQNGKNRKMATYLPHFALIGVMAGMETHLWEPQWSARHKWDYIERHGITTLFGPPSDYFPLLEYARKHQMRLPACLQHLFFGSAPVHHAFLQQVELVSPEHITLTCLYGMTENLVVCTVDGREKAAAANLSGDWVGRPLPGVELNIAPDGEVMLRSPQLFSHYDHLKKRDAWHATGDFGYLDADRGLVLMGRKKDMIIRGNFNLYPGLYESTINRYPGVIDSAFVGVYDTEKHDEIVGLFVETQAPVDARQFRLALADGPYSIDAQAMPDVILFEALPRSGRQSKVDKAALRLRLQQYLQS